MSDSAVDAAVAAYDECATGLEVIPDCLEQLGADLGITPQPSDAPQPETGARPESEHPPVADQVAQPLTATVILTWGDRTDLELAAVPVYADSLDVPAPQMSWDFKPEGALLADETVCPDVSGIEQLELTEPGSYDISVGVWSGCIINDEQLPHYAGYAIEVRYSDGTTSEITGAVEGQIWQIVTQVDIP